MSPRELARVLRVTSKDYIVRVSNGVSERPDLRIECHTRTHAEKIDRRYKREGHPSRVEAILR